MTKTIGYLKGYYGYKNFGDELLALGVIQYICSHYPLKKLYIEVEDVDRFWTRLYRHESLLGNALSKVNLISASDKISVIRHSILDPRVHLFLGGGEIFTPARGWFHGGRNMYILYRLSFIRHNVTLLGGVSKANNWCFKLLYTLTLSSCDKLILREPISYNYVVSNYVSKDKVILYQDFGKTLLDSLPLSTNDNNNTLSTTRPLCPYLLVNTNPHVDMSILTNKLSILTKEKNIQTCVYFPGDKVDTQFFEYLSTQFLTLKWTLFDWTKYDIFAIIDICKHASYGLGVRLHVLSMLHRYGVPFDYVVYQEKISKFLANQERKVEEF